jgi:phosphatidylglycerol---prolipoprotein diacylglyceryl transferase
MFPTLSDLFAYLFHIHVRIPIETLGLFMALAFVVTYMTYVSEFKRKEAQGLVHPFKRKVIVGEPASVAELLINGLLGFVFGYKFIGIIIDYKHFITDPKKFIFSLQGSWIAGLIFGIAWAAWAWYSRKKEQLPKPKAVEETVHPYQIMVKVTFWAGVIGFAGAKLFDMVEHWHVFLSNPLGTIFSSTGFTYYGGFIFGMLTFFYIGVRHGMKLAHVSDTGAPGIMLAYGVGRIGCELSGDGDWGIVNVHPKPEWLHWLPDWMWASNYPHNAVNIGEYITGCAGQYCHILPQGVYPTSFYEAVICIGLFGLMWAIRKKVNIGGFMSFFYLILIGIERFFIEFIKVNIRYNIFGVSLTQAQVISVLEFIVGTVGMIYILTHRRRKQNQPHHK